VAVFVLLLAGPISSPSEAQQVHAEAALQHRLGEDVLEHHQWD
jgi:hypothetical protein